MTKPCPVCGYAFSFWFMFWRSWIWSRWTCPRCGSKLGYDVNRRFLLALVLSVVVLAFILLGGKLVVPGLTRLTCLSFALAVAVPYAWAWFRFEKLSVIERKGGFCEHCGYNLTGNTTGRCPECGETTRNGAGG